nr:EOG090X0QLW [Triops cancriformis]
MSRTEGGFSGAKDPDDIYIDSSGDGAGYDDEDTPSPPKVGTLQSRSNKPVAKTTTTSTTAPTTTTSTTTRAPPPAPPTQARPVQPDDFDDELDEENSGSGAGIDVDGEEDEDDDITDTDEDVDITSVIGEDIDESKKDEEGGTPVFEVGEPRKPHPPVQPEFPEDVDNRENEIMVDPPSRSVPVDSVGSEPDKEKSNPNSDVHILGRKHEDRPTSFFAQPGVLAGKLRKVFDDSAFLNFHVFSVFFVCSNIVAVIGGAVVGLLCAILLVMFIVYRMRKKDEGSYVLDEPKRSPTSNSYSKNSREFYA